MSALLVYLLKATVLLSVFLAFFLPVMRRSGHFRFNRFMLLGGSALCLLLPLLRLRVSRPTLYSAWLEPVIVTGVEGGTPDVTDSAGGLTLSWQAVILAAYLIGALITLGYYLYSYGRMFRLLRRTPAEPRAGILLHLVPYETPSFSWMRHVVMNQEDFTRHPAILLHERAHVCCGHSRDLLLSSVLTVLQWFNPLVWLGRSELKLLHEYQADDFVLNQGIDATQYQLLLVKKAVGEKRFLLANGFNHAQLKNRITMMQNTSRAAWKKISALLILPILAAVTLLLAECKSANKNAAEPVQEAVADAEAEETFDFSLLDVKPMFQDKEANQFAYWVNENLKYPKEAVKDSLQGRVLIQFVIEKDGSVTGARILRSAAPVLDEETLRVISQSPQWTPGYVNGEPVRVTYNFPVVFKLQ